MSLTYTIQQFHVMFHLYLSRIFKNVPHPDERVEQQGEMFEYVFPALCLPGGRSILSSTPPLLGSLVLFDVCCVRLSKTDS